MNDDFEQEIIEEGISGDEPLISHNHSNNNNYANRNNGRNNNQRRTRGTNLEQRRPSNRNNNPLANKANIAKKTGGNGKKNGVGSNGNNALKNSLMNNRTREKRYNNGVNSSQGNSSDSSVNETNNNKTSSFMNRFTNSNSSLQEDEQRLKIRIPFSIKATVILSGVFLLLFVAIFVTIIPSVFLGVLTDSSASAPYEPTCETVTVKYCFNNTTGEIVTNWSDVSGDYENGRYFSVNDCRIEEVEMDFETYIEKVVDGEVGVLNNMEVYKALAVAARTYALNSLNSCSIRSSTKNQFVIYGEARADVKQAVKETYHEVLLTEDDSKESGVTLASQIEYDSFRCVEKDEDYYYMAQPTLEDAGEDEGDQIPVEWVHENVKYYMEGGVVPCSPVGSNGIGHGRGMSQYGALYYAESNPDSTYKDILKHYYGNKIVLFSCDDFNEEAILDENAVLEGINGESIFVEDFESIYKSCELLGKFD